MFAIASIRIAQSSGVSQFSLINRSAAAYCGRGMGGTGFMVRPPTPFTRPYRVVVKARKVARPKDFIWQIVRHDPGQDVILKTSEQRFKTMEEAYSGGSIALIRYHKA